MKTPILDQIEFQMDNGIILLVAAVVVISVLVWIVNKLINILVDKRVKRQLNKAKMAQQHKAYRKEVINNFFENSIRYDIDNMSSDLTQKANELISTYVD